MAQSEQSSGHEEAGSQTVQNIRGKFLSAPSDPGFKPEYEDVSSIWQSLAFVLTVLNLVYQRGIQEGLPGGPVVKNLPCNTGDIGLIPRQGTRIPHAMEHLSPHATNTEPTCQCAATEDLV